MRPYRGFTGKRWVYGDLVRTGKYCHIVQTTQDYQKVHAVINAAEGEFERNDIAKTFILVIPSSVGQSTGLKDIHKKDSYGGDIIEMIYRDGSREQGHIEYFENKARFLFISHEEDGGSYSFDDTTEFEIIGNTYQNPELMEKDNV